MSDAARAKAQELAGSMPAEWTFDVFVEWLAGCLDAYAAERTAGLRALVEALLPCLCRVDTFYGTRICARCQALAATKGQG